MADPAEEQVKEDPTSEDIHESIRKTHKKQQPPPTGIAARLKAQKERNAKLKKIQDKLTKTETQTTDTKFSFDPNMTTKQKIQAVQTSDLSLQEKTALLKTLSNVQVHEPQMKLPVTETIPPAPKPKPKPEPEPEPAPKPPEDTPATSQAKVQEETQEDYGEIVGPPSQQLGPAGTVAGQADPDWLIEGARPGGGLDEQGMPIQPFTDPVDTPAARMVHQMQADYFRETGKKLYISSGQRTIEENLAAHNLEDTPENRAKMAKGQHVRQVAYDFFMAPDKKWGTIMVGGKEYNTGHRRTEEWQWLNANAHKYGFVNTAPKEKKTGRTEWWHWEYTGEKGGGAPPPVKLSPFEGNLPDTREGTLKYLKDQYNAIADQQGQAEGLLAIGQEGKRLSDATQASLRQQYRDAELLVEEQKKSTKLVEEAKLNLAKTEEVAAAAESGAAKIKEHYQQLWDTEAFQAGQERIKQIDAKIAQMDATEISPMGPFGFYSTKYDKKTGETTTEWDTGRAIGTVLSGLALLANSALTVMSAADKKAGTIPNLVFEMFMAVIQESNKAQLNSIDKDKSIIDRKAAQYARVYQLLGDRKAFAAQAYVNKIGTIRAHVQAEKAKLATLQQKALFDTLDERLAHAASTRLVERDKAIMEAYSKTARNRIDSVNAVEARQNQRITTYLNGLTQIANLKYKQKKGTLSAIEKQTVNAAQKFMPTLSEVAMLWERSGQPGVVEWLTKRVAGWEVLKDSPWKWETLSDLHKLESIQKEVAGLLVRIQGETGNLNEDEQRRAMNQIPFDDESGLGNWKIKRLWARFQALANPRYQLLSPEQKQEMGYLVLAENDDLEGIQNQIKIYQRFNDAWAAEREGRIAGTEPGTMRPKKRTNQFGFKPYAQDDN
jgi:hypothetical protein